MPEVSVHYVDSPLKFATTDERQLPKVIQRWPDNQSFELPQYMVPLARENTFMPDQNYSEYLEFTENRMKEKRGIAAIAIQKAALDGGCLGLSIDHAAFRESIDSATNTDELVLAFGLYTTLIRNTGDILKTRDHDGTLVHSGVVDDISLMFTKLYDLTDGLDLYESEIVFNDLLENFTTYQQEYNNTNITIFLIRNAFYDIVGNPKEVLHPATVFGTKLLKYMLHNRETAASPSSITSTVKLFISSPINLIRNPELFFLYEEEDSHRRPSRPLAEARVGGMINAFFSRLEQVSDEGAFEHNVAKGYKTIADRVLGSVNSNRRMGKSSSVFLPTAVTSLATALSNAAKDEAEKIPVQQINDFVGSFEYILETLRSTGSLNKLWPGVEPATIDTFTVMLLKVARSIR